MNYIITKITDLVDDRKFYFTVQHNGFTWFFYDLVKAENFIKSNSQGKGKYDYKEERKDLF